MLVTRSIADLSSSPYALEHKGLRCSPPLADSALWPFPPATRPGRLVGAPPRPCDLRDADCIRQRQGSPICSLPAFGAFWGCFSASAARNPHSRGYRCSQPSRTLAQTCCSTGGITCCTNISKRLRTAPGLRRSEPFRRHPNVKSGRTWTYGRVGARSRGGLEASILATGQHRHCEALRAAACGERDSVAPTGGNFPKIKTAGEAPQP